MASKTTICNIALSLVGVSKLVSITESSTAPESTQPLLHYDPCREALLRAHPWGFAERRDYLALINVDTPGWDYTYQYPSGCLFAREIFSPEYDTDTGGISVPTEPFMIMAKSNLKGKQIVCNLEEAALKWTADISDVNMMDSLFRQALAWSIAEKIAVPIIGRKDGAKVMADMHKGFKEAFALATTTDANEMHEEPTKQFNSFLDARS